MLLKVIRTIIGMAAVASGALLSTTALSADAIVYSIYRGVDLGNPGEAPLKDFYVNVGSSQGVREGSVLEVLRKVPTYDLLTEKLYKDVIFPIARIRVIHVEQSAAVARLERMLPTDRTPSITPRAIMIGDFVRMNE